VFNDTALRRMIYKQDKEEKDEENYTIRTCKM
jgi:hypothetical protein